MSDDLQYTQEIGFKRNDSGTFGADTITNGAETFFKFGDRGQSFGDFPILETEIISQYTGESYDPKSLNVAKTGVLGNIVGHMVNGLPFYFMNCRKESAGGEEDGGVIDDGANQYTITPITSGEVDNYTVRYHSKNSDAADTQRSTVGDRFNNFVMSLDNRLKKSPLSFTLAFLGQQDQPVQANTDDYSLEFPDDLDIPFYWDGTSGSQFRWDVDGDDVELNDELLQFAYTENTLNRLVPVNGQHYPKYNVTGDRIHVLSFEVERRNETSVLDDYFAQSGNSKVPNETFKNLRFKISNANSKFIQCDFDTIAIRSIKMNDAFKQGSQIPIYKVVATARKIAPVIKDGITTLSHYGISE